MRRIAGVMVVLAACAGDPAPAPSSAQPRDPVLAPIARAEASRWTGVIAPAEAVDVAPPFDGVLAEVAVRPGDTVAAGQVVALLDERLLRQELEAARAALRETRARAPRVAVDIRSARRRVEIEERAVENGTSARRVLEEARFGLAAAKAARGELAAAIAQARTRVNRARSQLHQTALRAPFAGAIGARYRDAGAAVGPQAPVLRLIGGGGLRLRFAVSPAAARTLALGAEVSVEIAAAEPVRGIIEQIAPEVDQPSQTVFVDAALDPGSTAGLQPGLAAIVRPVVAREPGRIARP